MRDFLEMDKQKSQAQHRIFTRGAKAERFCNQGEIRGRAMPSAYRGRPSARFSCGRTKADRFCDQGERCCRAMPSALSFTSK